MNNAIEILLCGDDNLFLSFELVICSTMIHNNTIHWHIFTMDTKKLNRLNLTHRHLLKNIVDSFENNSTIQFYDVDKEYKKYFPNSVNDDTIFTPLAAMRLISDDFFPSLSRLLYLDNDMIIQGNLYCLYNNYAQIYPYAACYLRSHQMDSGTLVLNLDLCRKLDILAKARKLYNTKKYQYPDQEALEEVMLPQPLSRSYNYTVTTKSYLCDIMNLDYPCILHFCGGWVEGDVDRKPYGKTLEEWLKIYPYFGFLGERIKKGEQYA